MMSSWIYLFFVHILRIQNGILADDSDERYNTIVNDLMKKFETREERCMNKQYLDHSAELLEDSKALLKKIETYKEVLKTHKDIRDGLKWILAESTGLNRIPMILDYIKSDIKKPCSITQDCSALKKEFPSWSSGIYTIFPEENKQGVKVYCDMDTDEGGWTVIQRRTDGLTSFDRTWQEYENGFGNKEREYWLGNKYLHMMTSNWNYQLKVVLTDDNNQETNAIYNIFSIGDQRSKYVLTIGGYSGTAGDWMKQNNKRKFSAKDQDNDTNSGNCANRPDQSHGAWWHFSCSYSDLNVKYDKKLRWNSYKYLKSVMMIRRLN